MPTYEYRCPKGHEFERFQKMSDDPVAECPECGESAERLLSGGAGFLFKGSGFYITDYRSESYRKAAKADQAQAKGGSGDGGGSGAKSDTGGSGSATKKEPGGSGSTTKKGSGGSGSSASSGD